MVNFNGWSAIRTLKFSFLRAQGREENFSSTLFLSSSRPLGISRSTTFYTFFQLCQLLRNRLLCQRMDALYWRSLFYSGCYFHYHVQVGHNERKSAEVFLNFVLFSRSLITKYVEPDEVGKIFSIVGTFQALLPFASGPLFGFLYRDTVAFLPSAFLLVVAGFKLIEDFSDGTCSMEK